LAKKIDLGCGKNIKEGFIGIDKILGVDIDKVGIPFPDETINEIYSFHFLEHTDDLVFVFKEIHRVLKSNCIAEVIVPHFSNIGAFHWTHRHFFNVRGFDFIEKNHPHHFYCPDISFQIIDKNIEFKEKRNVSFSILERIVNINKFSQRVYEQYFSGWFRAYQIRIIMRKD